MFALPPWKKGFFWGCGAFLELKSISTWLTFIPVSQCSRKILQGLYYSVSPPWLETGVVLVFKVWIQNCALSIYAKVHSEMLSKLTNKHTNRRASRPVIKANALLCSGSGVPGNIYIKPGTNNIDYFHMKSMVFGSLQEWWNIVRC